MPAGTYPKMLQLFKKTGFPTKDFGNDRLKNIVKGQRPNKGICGGMTGKNAEKRGRQEWGKYTLCVIRRRS